MAAIEGFLAAIEGVGVDAPCVHPEAHPAVKVQGVGIEAVRECAVLLLSLTQQLLCVNIDSSDGRGVRVISICNTIDFASG